MATPTIFTPFQAKGQLTATAATLYTFGASGGILDYLVCTTIELGVDHTVTFYVIPSGGTAGDANTIAKTITIPGDGWPVNILQILGGRPFHALGADFIQGLGDVTLKVNYFLGGTDYA